MYITQKDLEECIDKGIIFENKKDADLKVIRYSQDVRKKVFKIEIVKEDKKIKD